MAKHFKFIEEDVVAWVELREKLPFRHVEGGGMARGMRSVIRQRTIRARKVWGRQDTVNMPSSIHVSSLFPMCNNGRFRCANVIRESMERAIQKEFTPT